MSEEKTKFLSFKDPTTDRTICVGITEPGNVQELIDQLKEQGCVDFVRLDADKKPISN